MRGRGHHVPIPGGGGRVTKLIAIPPTPGLDSLLVKLEVGFAPCTPSSCFAAAILATFANIAGLPRLLGAITRAARHRQAKTTITRTRGRHSAKIDVDEASLMKP